MKNLIFILLCLLLFACEGKEGPVGPTGLQGYNGVAGVDGVSGDDGIDSVATNYIYVTNTVYVTNTAQINQRQEVTLFAICDNVSATFIDERITLTSDIKVYCEINGIYTMVYSDIQVRIEEGTVAVETDPVKAIFYTGKTFILIISWWE